MDADEDKPKKTKAKIPDTICPECYGYLRTVDGIIAWCADGHGSWLISPPLPPEEFGPRGKR